MKKILFLLIVFSTIFFAQNETHRWSSTPIKYGIRKHKITKSNPRSSIWSITQTIYKSLISDYDGDNCPYYPPCSSFFVSAVEQAGLIQGILMFADRFMRDLNYFNRTNYPETKYGKLYDPPSNYILW